MEPPYPIDINSAFELGETSLLLDGITKVDYVEHFTHKGKDLLIVTGDHGEPVSLIVDEAARLAHRIAQEAGLPRPD